MGLREFAREELKRAGLFDEDSDYGGMLGESVMKMIDVFAEEGHSGWSASIAIHSFEKVARFEPLTPLTGDDDEWFLHDGYGGEPYYQNKRCSRVFKGADGQAYDIEGKVFREPSGSCYCSGESRVFITFPYMPTREYVDVPEQIQ